MSKKTTQQPGKNNDNPLANDISAPVEVQAVTKNGQRLKGKANKANLRKQLAVDDVFSKDTSPAEAEEIVKLAQLDTTKLPNDASVSDAQPLTDSLLPLSSEPELAIAALPSEYEAVAALPESGAVAWAELAGAAGSNTLLYAGLGALAAAGLGGGGGGGGGGAQANAGVKALPPTLSANLDPASDSSTPGDRLTNQAKPTLKGNATPGARITVALDTNGDGVADVTLTTTADETGAWSVTPTTRLPEGPITATIIATDSSGAQSAPAIVNLVVDTTIATPNPQLALVSDTGAVGDNITTAHTPTIRGSGAAPGDTITLALDTNGDGIADMTLVTVADTNGQWSVVPTSALPEGMITATVVASDAAGNVSAPGTLTLTVAPILTVGLDSASDSGKQGDLLTNDTTPTVTGVGRPGDLVTVVSPTGETLTATVGPNGTWSVTPTVALPQGGPQEFKASTTDLAGVTTTAAVAVTIDSIAGIAPTVTIAGDGNNDGFLNAAELGAGLTVAVTIGLPPSAVAGDTITVSDGTTTQKIVLTPADIANHTLAATVTRPAEGATLSVTASLTDIAGNTTPNSVDAGKIDTTAPDAPTVFINTDTSDDGTINAVELDGALAITATVTIPNNAQLGQTLLISDNFGHTRSFIVDQAMLLTHSVQTTFPAPGEQQKIIVSATLADEAGNVSAPGSDNATLSTLPPGTPIITILTDGNNDQLINIVEANSSPVLRVSVQLPTTPGFESKVGDSLVVDDGVNPAQTFVLTAQDIAQGTVAVSFPMPANAAAVTVSAHLVDSVGNLSAASHDTATLDTVALAAPLVEILEDSNNNGYIANSELSGQVDVRVTLPAGAAVGDTLLVQDNAGNVKSVTLTADLILANQVGVSFPAPAQNATFSVTASVTDIAGNPGAISAPDSAIVDTLAPAAPIADLAASSDSGLAGDHITNIVTPVITGTGTPNGTITVVIAGQTLTTTVADDGTWSVTPAALLDNNYVAAVTETDAAGNTASTTANVTVDTKAPVATLTGNVVTSDNVVNIAESAGNVPVSGSVTGEFTPGDIITLTINGHVYTGPVTAAGAFSISVAGSDLVADADHKIDIALAAHDIAGNPATITGAQAFGVDVSAPTPSLAPNNVTTDNVINIAESALTTTPLTGKITGDFVAGDVVTLVVDGVSYTGPVDASGNYNIAVPTSGLIADADKVIAISFTTTDAAGNSTTVTGTKAYSLDTTAPSATISPDQVTVDNVINIAESAAATTAITGKVSGEFIAGDIVTLTVNGVNYTGPVDALGNYSIAVATPALIADTDKTIAISFTTTDAAGNSATIVGAKSYSLDTAAPNVSIAPNPVTVDNIINIAEGANATTPITGKVAGEFNAGDTMTLNVNGVNYTGTVDASGNYSIDVPTTGLLADGDRTINLSFTTTDAAGNSTTVIGTKPYSIDTTAPLPAITVDSVTADSVVNITEGQSAGVPITGTVTGDFKVGDVVTLNVNGTLYTGSVDAAGKYNIAVPGAELLADSDKTIAVSFTTVDAAGNSTTITATKPYSVDQSAPAPILSIDSVTADNVINIAEGGNAAVPITGKVTGDFVVGDIVTLTINGATYSGPVNATGNYSINVPGSALLADADKTIDVSFTTLDAAGNSTTATTVKAYTTDTQAPVATVSIGAVTADDVLNAAEVGAFVPLSGTVSGQFLAGDIVTVTVNGVAYTSAVDGSGNYVVNVAGSDLAADSNKTIDVSVIAHDLAGNSSTATTDHAYIVDIAAPTIAISRSGSGALLNGQTETLTFTLSEAVSGFSGSDIIVSAGSSISGFTAVSSTVYTAILTIGTANATVSVGNAAFTDTAGNANVDGTDLNNSLTIIAANDAPVLELSSPANYTEDSAGSVIESNLLLNDVDDAQLTGATVKITAGLQVGQDFLDFEAVAGISGSYIAATGILTLSGTASKADYEAALESIKFRTLGQDPTATTSTRTVEFSVTDFGSGSGAGQLDSAWVSKVINITPVNDAPTVLFAGAAAALVVNTYARIDGGIVISDVDDTEMSSGTLKLLNWDKNNDSISLDGINPIGDSGTFNGIDYTFDASSGVLQLSTTASAAAYQEFFQNVFFKGIPEPRQIIAQIEVTDANSDGVGAATSFTVEREINLEFAPNEAPIVSIAGTGSYSEGAGLTRVGAAISNIADSDDTKLLSASVVISGHFLAGDTLDVTTQAGISKSFDPATGILTLSGSASTADYLAVLQSLSFQNASADPTAGGTAITRTVTISVQDNFHAQTSNIIAVGSNDFTINIAAINNAPINTVPGIQATNEDTARVIAGLAVSDIDAASGSLTVTLAVTHGTLNVVGGSATITDNNSASVTITGTVAQINSTLSAISSVTFNPTANYNGNAALTMTTNDNGNTGGGALTNVSVVPITVAPVSDAPVGANKTLTAQEDTALVVNTADFGFSDAADLVPNAFTNVTITALGGAGTLFLDANNDGVVDAGETVSVGDSISKATLDLGQLKFLAANNANGNAYANFSFKVQDNGGTANGGADTALIANTITLNVNPVNDGPIANLVTASGNEDSPINVILSGSDIDGTIASAKVSALPTAAQGVLYLSDGTTPVTTAMVLLPTQMASLVFKPALNYNGTVSIPFSVTDNEGGVSAASSVTIAVNAVNDAPIATVVAVSGVEDASSISLSLAGTDVDGTIATAKISSLPLASQGLLYLADGVTLVTTSMDLLPAQMTGLIFKPTANFNGTVNIPFTVTDNLGLVSAISNATISISAVNDAPVMTLPINNLVSNGSFESGATGWTGNSGVEVGFAPSAYGLSSAADGARLLEVEGFALSTPTVRAYVEQVITTIPGETYTYAFQAVTRVNVNVGDRGIMTVDGVNLLSFTTGNTWGSYATSFVASGTSTTIRIYSDGSTSGTLPLAGDGNGLLVDDIKVTSAYNTYLEGGPAKALISNAATLTDIDDANMESAAVSLTNAQANDQLFVNGSSAASGTLASGITWTRTGSTVNFSGSASKADYLAAMKLVQFENLNENNSPTVARSFTVTVNDGDVSSTLISGKLYVQAVNDAPVANAVVASATEDTPAVNFSLSGSDVDGTIASANITTLPTAAQGILYLADGTTPVTSAMNLTTAQMAGLVFKPTANYNGTVAIGYTVTDNQGGVSVPANATITITAVNDAPVATAVTASGNEDAGPITLSLAGTDVDGTIASAKVSALPTGAQGVLYLADGSTPVTTAMVLTPLQMAGLVFKPTLNYNGTVNIPFTVTDNLGLVSASTNAVITVNSVNDVPVATAVSASALEDATSVSFSLAGTDIDGTVASANITTLPTAAQGVLYLADGTTPVTSAMNLTTAQMAGLVFKPTANYNGTVAIGYTVTDNQGGVSVPANSTITITAVNDAPVATAVTASGNEDAGPITLSLAGTDVDGTIASAKVSALPAAAQGVLYLADGTTAVTTAMALTPTQMASLVFKPTLNYNGSVNIAYTVTDNLGLVSASTNATVTVAAVNDAPTWSAAAPTITVSEQSTTTLNGRGLLISDVDAGTGPMTLTISSGTSTDALTVAAGTSGVTIVSGNGTSAVVLQGTLAQLDALLASTGAAGTITHAQTAFTPTVNEGVTSATINLLVNDQGNTGSGGALSASKDVTITITSVASTVPGDGAVNTLYGGGAPDLLIGGGGADTLYGGAGDDVLVGDGGYIRNGSFEYWTGGTASASGSGSGFTLVGASVMPGITFNNFAGVGANAYLGSWSAAGVPSSALEWVNGNAAIPYQAGLLVADVGVSATTVGGATFSKIWAGAGETYDLKFLLTDKDIGINTAGENWQVVWNGATIGTISSTGAITGLAAGITATSTALGDIDNTTTVTNQIRDYTFSGLTTVAGGNNTVSIQQATGSANARDLDYVRMVGTNTGAGGDDTLDGGTGNDTFFGGVGNDIMTGGAGADTFVISAGFNNGNDVVTDFVVGTDKLQLVDLLALGHLTTQKPNLVASPTILISDLISATATGLAGHAGPDQTVTWNDATHTLGFAWGGSVTFTGMTTSYASAAAFLTANGLLTADGFQAQGW